MQFKKNDIIFKQGQVGDHAYLIEHGQVEIFHTLKNDQEAHLAILGQGELFGEMALIDANIRSASARALSDCRLLIIGKDQLTEKIGVSDPVVQLIMRILLKRLRQQNQSHSGVSLENMQTSLNVNAVDRLRLENQIYEAYKHREFQIYHQPIINMLDDSINGSEALIRWESPTQGLISPGVFVDVLENSSMIVPVGYWIFEECFEHYKKIRDSQKHTEFSMSINVSGRQFADHGFIDTLKKLLQRHEVKAENFKLEITERILMEGGAVIDVLNQCRELGFEISLDDFGTGFSSLQYLALMPINYIKIDRSFVMNVLKDERTRAVIRSIIYLAEQLKVKIISEGIETVEEAQVMKALGSDFGQGYLYSRPIPLNQFLSR